MNGIIKTNFGAVKLNGTKNRYNSPVQVWDISQIETILASLRSSADGVQPELSSLGIHVVQHSQGRQLVAIVGADLCVCPGARARAPLPLLEGMRHQVADQAVGPFDRVQSDCNPSGVGRNQFGNSGVAVDIGHGTTQELLEMRILEPISGCLLSPVTR